MSECVDGPARPLSARWPVLLLAAIVIGWLDMGLAMVFWGLRGVPPVRVLQSVASGLLGPAASAGGTATALLGLLLHLSIAFAMVLAYDQAARRLPWLVRRPSLWGALYGVALYLVMTCVVVPLSAAAHTTPTGAWLVASVFSHVVLVGLPCAWFVRFAQAPPVPAAAPALHDGP